MDQAALDDVDLVCFQSWQSWKGRSHLQHNATLFSQMNPDVLDGLILIGVRDEQLLRNIPGAGTVPTVTIQQSPFPYLEADNHLGTTLALEHLWSAHHHHAIAFLRGTPGESSGEERYKAYQDFIQTHHL